MLGMFIGIVGALICSILYRYGTKDWFIFYCIGFFTAWAIVKVTE